MNTNYPTTSSTDIADVSTTNVTGDLTGGVQATTTTTYSESPSTAQKVGASLRTELSNLKSDLDTLLARATTMSDTELSREHARLMAKFSSVRSAAIGMASQGKEQFSRMATQGREHFSRVAGQGKEQFSRVTTQGKQQFNQGMELTTDYVKEKPMQAVAVATGVGLVLGMLLKRR